MTTLLETINGFEDGLAGVINTIPTPGVGDVGWREVNDPAYVRTGLLSMGFTDGAGSYDAGADILGDAYSTPEFSVEWDTLRIWILWDARLTLGVDVLTVELIRGSDSSVEVTLSDATIKAAATLAAGAWFSVEMDVSLLNGDLDTFYLHFQFDSVATTLGVTGAGVFIDDVEYDVPVPVDPPPEHDGPDFLRSDRDRLAEVVAGLLFADRRAAEDDTLPPGETSRAGWWADILDREGKGSGSKLWLLRGSKLSTETLDRVRGYILEALQPLLDAGVATTIEVVVERSSSPSTRPDIAAEVKILRGRKVVADLRYVSLWEGR